jgi:serine/threonine-protein kinase RsbW
VKRVLFVCIGNACRSQMAEGFARTVRIADEGEGFDYSHLPDPLAPENLLRTSGRGIFLIRSFMDDFHARRLEPAGTEVTLVKFAVSK